MRYDLVVVDAEKASRAWGQPISVGFVWAANVEMDCPHGLPNCRNCGNPDSPCTGNDHCGGCGTAHGISPNSVLVAKGLALRPLEV